MSQQVLGLEQQLDTLHSNVQRELDDGGFRLGPVKSRLQQLLADFAIRPSLPEDFVRSIRHAKAQQGPSEGYATKPILDPADQVSMQGLRDATLVLLFLPEMHLWSGCLPTSLTVMHLKDLAMLSADCK